MGFMKKFLEEKCPSWHITSGETSAQLVTWAVVLEHWVEVVFSGFSTVQLLLFPFHTLFTEVMLLILCWSFYSISIAFEKKNYLWARFRPAVKLRLLERISVCHIQVPENTFTQGQRPRVGSWVCTPGQSCSSLLHSRGEDGTDAQGLDPLLASPHHADPKLHFCACHTLMLSNLRVWFSGISKCPEVQSGFSVPLIPSFSFPFTFA